MKNLIKLAAEKAGYEIRQKPSTLALVERDPFLVTKMLVSARQPMIFDVGANVGKTALKYRSIFPNSLIHCFEPFPDSFKLLSEALAQDGDSKTHLLALSDVVGVANLSVNQSKATNSLLPSDRRAAQYWGGNWLETEAEIEVKTDTIDEFCKQHKIDRIDILKLDVQGAEYSVLKGAHQMLTRQAIDIVYMEMITAPTYIGQRKLHEYLELFATYDYEIFDFYNSLHKNSRLIQTDNIMVSSKFLKQFEQR
jgi:FkbM family methyltransferase